MERGKKEHLWPLLEDLFHDISFVRLRENGRVKTSMEATLIWHQEPITSSVWLHFGETGLAFLNVGDSGGVRSRAWFNSSFNPKLLLTQNQRKLGSIISQPWVESRTKFQMKHKVPDLHGANQRKCWHWCQQDKQPSSADIYMVLLFQLPTKN